jgi:hypothetical protein
MYTTNLSSFLASRSSIHNMLCILLLFFILLHLNSMISTTQQQRKLYRLSLHLETIKSAQYPTDFMNSTRILYMHKYTPLVHQINPSIHTRISVRNVAILLEISNGLIFTNAKRSLTDQDDLNYHTQTVLALEDNRRSSHCPSCSCTTVY